MVTMKRVLKVTLKVAFAALFLISGFNHFLQPALFVQIMPPLLPYPLALVYLSGGFEILLGTMLLVPQFSRLAAWGLIALLIAVFPANIYMAVNPERYPDLHPIILWLRLPLQGLLIAWAWAYTRPPRITKATG
jgi:uncharacterized membrane protein